MRTSIFLVALVAIASQLMGQEKDPGTSVANITPNPFFTRGSPTFVLGTGGDDSADRDIAAQAGVVRDRFFPGAPIVLDGSIDVDKGPAGWPPNVIVYGGPHVNPLLARLAPSLPFRMERGKLTLGDRVFEREDTWLIAVIPARERDAMGPGYPEFVLYAGTGSPGVTEINHVNHGGDPILVADAQDHRRLVTGKWEKTGEGGLRAFLFGQGLPEARRVELWREDLRFYGRELPARHKDFYKLIGRQEFSRELADLESAVPRLSDQEIALRLMRLTASLRVAHTYVPWASDVVFHKLPLTLRWFSDGLWVTGAAAEWREAIGARVVGVGSMPPEQLETALAPYIAHENGAWLRQSSPAFMVMDEALREVRVVEPDGRVPFRFVNTAGADFTLRLAATEPDVAGGSSGEIETLRPSATLCLKDPGKGYWYEYLAESETLYIQYNRCANDPAESFENFIRRLFAFSDAHEIEKVVVDLRSNGGGDSEIVKPLIDGLRSRPALRAKGRLYGLIGPRTFSSGLWAGLELRKLGATLVGEPTGGKPNGHGDVRHLDLPNSGLRVSYSTQNFQLVRGDPLSLEPDILVTQTFGEFMAGSDPVLERVLDTRASKTDIRLR